MSKGAKAIGSGVHDNPATFLVLLEDQRIPTMVVEPKDRARRFGFRSLDTLLRGQGRRLEVVNLAEKNREDVLAGLVSIVYSFAPWRDAKPRAQRKTEVMVK